MPRIRNIASFAELEKEFIERVNKMVWCNVATLDTQNRLRSRVLHPIWEGQTGWIGTRRHSLKEKHLAHHPYVSLAYIADLVKPVYVDCTAEWDDSPASKQHVWDMFLAAPPPLGYDPAPIFHSVEHPDFGLLKLTPWRVELADATGESLVWKR
jgi:general stress protein 26